MKTKILFTIILTLIALIIIIPSCKKNGASNSSYATNPSNPSTPNGWSNGILPGVFSISYNQRVCFSQGNLQYQASTDTWRFAKHQWDYIGYNNVYISPNYSGWIDLFGWGTGNNPTNTSEDYHDYIIFTDWGNNAISNGGNISNTWRTLTESEWIYLFETRATNDGIRFATARINGVYGLILLPDNWSNSTYYLNQHGYNADISAKEWTKLETAGAVFLPAAGKREWLWYFESSDPRYWSSSSSGFFEKYASVLNFSYGDGYGSYQLMDDDRLNKGNSVRLVRDVQ